MKRRAAPSLSVRRLLLQAGAVLGAQALLQPAAAIVPGPDMVTLIIQFLGTQRLRHGRVHIDISPWADDGEVVPLQVTVDSPMSANDHVTEIGVFNEQAGYEVARFRLGPRNGRADVATRIRLVASQKLMALARMNDGTVWADSAEVVVVPAACSEPPPADAAQRAQVQLPGSALSGQLIPVRASILHGMEARCRQAGAGGTAARELLRRFACRYDGETVFGAQLSAAVAADPYLVFHLLAERSGTLEFEWQGDQGFRHLERRELRVT